MKFSRITVLLILFTLTSCDKFQYNVYETHRKEKDQTVSAQYNINLLLSKPLKDTIYLALFGDPQRFYDDLEDLVESVNNLEKIDAVIITGDITDFGTRIEFDLINTFLKRLKVPFITTIGNHDCLANGKDLYQEIYGPLNLSFTWNGVRFIVHNTNSREFSFNGSVPDISWMREQIADSSLFSSCIFISHVPSNHPDFDQALLTDYTHTIRNAKNTIFSTNGHRHVYILDQPYQDGIWYLNTNSPTNRIYHHVSVYPFSSENKKFDVCSVGF